MQEKKEKKPRAISSWLRYQEAAISSGSKVLRDCKRLGKTPTIMKIIAGTSQNCQVTDLKVRLVADLSAAAFKTHQDKELALWHCLRCLNSNGSGYLDLEVAIEGLKLAFGYSRRSIFRLLAKGEGQFWHRIYAVRAPVIKIYGIKSVFVYFAIQLNNTARFVEVGADRFNTLKKRRLALWLSIPKPRGIRANPISRQSLEDYTGVNERRQQRYDKEARVKRQATWRPQNKEQPRLPNIYHSPVVPGPRGMLLKVRRYLKSFENDGAFELRRYFDSIPKMMKTKHRVDEVYLLTRANQRRIEGHIPGRREYELVGV